MTNYLSFLSAIAVFRLPITGAAQATAASSLIHVIHASKKVSILAENRFILNLTSSISILSKPAAPSSPRLTVLLLPLLNT